MSKKRARLRFVWFAIIVAIGLFLTVVPFNVPFTHSKFNGFVGGIDKGLDITGGQAVVYKATLQNNNQDMQSSISKTAEKLKDAFSRLGVDDAVISTQGEDEIKVEVVSAQDDLFQWIASPKQVFVTGFQYSDSSLSVPETIFSSKDITNVSPTYRLKEGSTSEVEYGILIEFGSDIAQKIKAAPNDELYVYIDEISTSAPFGTIEKDKLMSGTSAFIKSDTTASDQTTTVEYAYNILSGTYPVKLEYDRTEDFSGFLGANTMLYIGIAGAITLALLMILFWIRYGDFGLLADFALIVFTILYFFFMMTIPLIKLSLPTVLAIAVSYALVADSIMVILNKIKEEYARGNKIHLAVKGGFKRSLFPLLDTHAVIAAISLIVYFIGDASIKGFSFPLFVGTLISFFLTQVVLRFFLKSYLPLNSTNPKKLRFYREKGVKEIPEVKEEKEPEGVNILAPNAEELAGGQDK